MGAVLLLVGLVCAAITSPLFDRVFTNHLALCGKTAMPIMAACWFALIWESKYSSGPSYIRVSLMFPCYIRSQTKQRGGTLRTICDTRGLCTLNPSSCSGAWRRAHTERRSQLSRVMVRVSDSPLRRAV